MTVRELIVALNGLPETCLDLTVTVQILADSDITEVDASTVDVLPGRVCIL